MNPFVLFLPTFRASTTAFLLGLLVLAVFDYVRLNYGIPLVPGWILMLAVWFFTFSIQANRRRHAGESAAFALLPTFLAVLGKGIGTVVGIFPPIFEAMRSYAAENGVDVEDEAAFQQTVADPQFQEAFQAYLAENEAIMEGVLTATAMPSFIGYWLVIGLFAIWFAQMKRKGGSLDDTAPAAAPAAEVASEPAPKPVAEPSADTNTASEAAPTQEDSAQEVTEEAEPAETADSAEATPEEDAADEAVEAVEESPAEDAAEAETSSEVEPSDAETAEDDADSEADKDKPSS